MVDKTNYQKMISGELYNSVDPELFALAAATGQRRAEFSAIPPDDMVARVGALKNLLGAVGDFALILEPFHMDYGKHIKLGDQCFINSGATFLDSNYITIGDRVSVGPNVQFITATHPILPEERIVQAPGDPILPFRPMTIAKPITIDEDCWIGAGAIIMPGVSIGMATIVGAGAIVTKSLPERVIAVGNPARVIRSIDD